MIGKIKGKLAKKLNDKIFIDVNGLCYEVYTPKNTSLKLEKSLDEAVELIIYHYFQIDNSRGIPVLIGFIDELERDFFEVFIGVSGIGPKAALKAFDKPIPSIARAIEEGNLDYLKGLSGIGSQKAKQHIPKERCNQPQPSSC